MRHVSDSANERACGLEEFAQVSEMCSVLKDMEVFIQRKNPFSTIKPSLLHIYMSFNSNSNFLYFFFVKDLIC